MMNIAGVVVAGGLHEGNRTEAGYSLEVGGNSKVECSSGLQVTWAHATYTGDRQDNKTVPLVQFDDSRCSAEVHQGKFRDLQQI